MLKKILGWLMEIVMVISVGAGWYSWYYDNGWWTLAAFLLFVVAMVLFYFWIRIPIERKPKLYSLDRNRLIVYSGSNRIAVQSGDLTLVIDEDSDAPNYWYSYLHLLPSKKMLFVGGETIEDKKKLAEDCWVTLAKAENAVAVTLPARDEPWIVL